MKRLMLAFAAAAACAFAVNGAAGRGYGYRHVGMDWSHLGPRPQSAARDSGAPRLRATPNGHVEGMQFPSRFDLRAEGVVTSVKNQGPYGCCWAFGVCAALESVVARKFALSSEPDFSERNMALFCGADYVPEWDWYGLGLIDQGGDTTLADAYLFRWAGPVAEVDDPYPAFSTPALDALSEEYRDFFVYCLRYSGYPDADVSIKFISQLQFADWTNIDYLAWECGYGYNFRTNFIVTARVPYGKGKTVDMPRMRSELIPDEVYRDCTGRQGPWNVSFHVQANWRIPSREGPLDNATLKYALMEHGGASVPCYYDTAYQTDGVVLDDGPASVYYCPYDISPNHEMLLIGWDDDFPASAFPEGTRPPGDGAFLVRNAWGADVPGGGFIWISYYDPSFACGEYGVSCVYTRVDDPLSPENYDIVRGYDEQGLCGTVGFKKDTATAANIFVAEKAETIRAVGTYLVQWNTEYTVCIYTGCADGKPESGALACSLSGTREFPGYETIDLPLPVPVAAGERYSVVVTFRTPNYKYPVPVQIDTSSGAVHSPPKKRSFIKGSDKKWIDLVAYYKGSPNAFCCKTYSDEREPIPFDGDAKGVYTAELEDGSTLAVTVGAASAAGVCQVSAKVTKGKVTLSSFAARSVKVSDGAVVLMGSDGRSLRLGIAGSEEGGNTLSANLGGTELSGVVSLCPNIRGYGAGEFRVGVSAAGAPEFDNPSGLSLTWSASGLPAGVGINAKTGLLTGAPTKASSAVKTAKVVATAAGGGADAFSFTYTVAALDAWAAGTKTGGGEGSVLTLSVGSTGKVSGKYQADGTTWTISSQSYSSYAVAEDGSTHYYWQGDAKSGSVVMPFAADVHVAELTNCTRDVTVSAMPVADCTAGGAACAAYANVWGSQPYSTYAKVIAVSPALKLTPADLPGLADAETLTLKFGKNGTVTAAASLSGVSGKKAVSVAKTFSTTVVPVSSGADCAFRGQVFTFFAPDAKKKTKAFAARVGLRWDNFLFRQDLGD